MKKSSEIVGGGTFGINTAWVLQTRGHAVRKSHFLPLESNLRI